MIEVLDELMRSLSPKKEQIDFTELVELCLKNAALPKSKGDIYFLLTSLKALKIFEEEQRQQYKINWATYTKLKKEGIL